MNILFSRRIFALALSVYLAVTLFAAFSPASTTHAATAHATAVGTGGVRRHCEFLFAPQSAAQRHDTRRVDLIPTGDPTDSVHVIVRRVATPTQPSGKREVSWSLVPQLTVEQLNLLSEIF